MRRSLRALTLALITILVLVLIASANGNLVVDSWELIAPLPQPIAYHRAVMHGQMIYVVGGEVPAWTTPVASVLQAEVAPTSGAINAWVTPITPATPTGSPTPLVRLPMPLHRHAMVKASWGDQNSSTGIYVIGGWSNGNRYSEVWRADWIDSTATPATPQLLRSWTRVRDYPRKIIMHEAVYAQNYLYVLGGLDENDHPLDEVYFSKITENGELEGWTKAIQPLPNVRYRFAAVYAKRNCTPRIYILGGHDGTETKNQVYSIRIETDGSLKEDWVKQRSLPAALYHHQAIFDGTRLMVIGGRDDEESSDRVYSAIIKDNGELETWEEEALLPESLYRSAIAFDPNTSNGIYVLGGKHYEDFQAQVYRSLQLTAVSASTIGQNILHLPLIMGRQACS